MNSYEEHATERSSEDGGAAALLIVMALVFAGYFALRVVMPDLPLQIHQAIASLPG